MISTTDVALKRVLRVAGRRLYEPVVELEPTGVARQEGPLRIQFRQAAWEPAGVHQFRHS